MKQEGRYFIYDRPASNLITHYLIRLKSVCKALYYRLRMAKINSKSIEKNYSVSVCAIFKNESPYLREWIEFNRMVGVEHFFLYNNQSDDDYMSVLLPYISSGVVTLSDWPYNHKQMECYMDCIEKYSAETKWLGFIDIDEFIVPRDGGVVYDYLRKHEHNRGAVLIYWRLFGSSGRLSRDLRSLVVEDFTSCWPKHCDIGKCFYNTAFGFDKKSVHSRNLHHSFWACWNGMEIPPVNVFGCLCVGNRNIAKRSEFPIQINHYFTKSYEEYSKKMTKGDVYFEKNPHDDAYYHYHEDPCTAYDYSAMKYLTKFKSVMMDSNYDKEID